MDKLYCFKEELNLIKTPRIKTFLENAILDIPDYFFEIGASHSGEYHPKFALGKGGLLRHTKASVKIAEQFLRLEKYDCFSDEQKDLVISALVLHDARKGGLITDAGRTLREHPLLAVQGICDNCENLALLSIDEQKFLLDAISSHMGQFNTDEEGNEILPKPDALHRELVHICDYIASRKAWDIKL